jgi:CheY-like chemotaxis protein
MMASTRSSPSGDSRPLIVCVDDEADILEMLELALEDEGFDVLTVQRSGEAADVVREQKPALVLLDLLVPEMNGFEVLQELRSFSAVPVMILTARGNDSRCGRVGARADDSLLSLQPGRAGGGCGRCCAAQGTPRCAGRGGLRQRCAWTSSAGR